uniref:Uncharacterized protein n=1 Tax=Anguilla anguilla TaxID=7936 RepID=A0A0E9V5C2_ANGAN
MSLSQMLWSSLYVIPATEGAAQS